MRALDAALAGVAAFAAIVAIPSAAATAGTDLGNLVDSIRSAVPILQGRETIDIPAGGSTSIGAAPVVDSLPAYTREPQLQLTGRVPSFAVQPGRTLQIVLNGAIVATKPIEENGAFNTGLALKEGTNTIALTLVEQREIVAQSSHTIVLDRTPPTLTISQPTAGATVEAQNVVVAGKTDAGSSVTVNGRTVVATPDGTFTDYFTAPVGSLQITVVSRDRAGNETTQKVTAVAQSTSQSGATSLVVAVTPTTVRPGQGVLATISLRDPAGPRVGVQVTLSVGVIQIGTATTDASGTARIGFAAPTTEGDIGVVVLGGGSSGRATLTVSAR